MTDAEQAYQAVDCWSDIVAVVRRCLANVDGHTHAQWSGLRPRIGNKRTLSLDGGGDSRRRWERGLYGVTDGLEVHAAPAQQSPNGG